LYTNASLCYNFCHLPITDAGHRFGQQFEQFRGVEFPGDHHLTTAVGDLLRRGWRQVAQQPAGKIFNIVDFLANTRVRTVREHGDVGSGHLPHGPCGGHAVLDHSSHAVNEFGVLEHYEMDGDYQRDALWKPLGAAPLEHVELLGGALEKIFAILTAGDQGGKVAQGA
jgi:hypothetical protein